MLFGPNHLTLCFRWLIYWFFIVKFELWCSYSLIIGVEMQVGLFIGSSFLKPYLNVQFLGIKLRFYFNNQKLFCGLVQLISVCFDIIHFHYTQSWVHYWVWLQCWQIVSGFLELSPSRHSTNYFHSWAYLFSVGRSLTLDYLLKVCFYIPQAHC